MGKPSKRKYLQAFLERTVRIQANSSQPETLEPLRLWVETRLAVQPNKRQAKQAMQAKQAKPTKLDVDLEHLTIRQLRKEVQRLRNAIREHLQSAQTSEEHQRLYRLLPENQ